MGPGAALPGAGARRRRRSAPCWSGCAISAGIAVDLDGLDEQADAYLQRVEEGLTDRPDVVEVIEAIEAGEAEEAELPSGDELASEIERFLRDQ